LKAPLGEKVFAFTPDGKTLLAGGGEHLLWWSMADGGQSPSVARVEGDQVTCLACFPDGKVAAVGYRHGGVRVWDWAANKRVRQLPYPGGVRAVAVSPDGKRVAAAGSGKIVLWDADSGQELRQIGKAAPVASLAFSPDGGKLAAGMFDSTIQIY